MDDVFRDEKTGIAVRFVKEWEVEPFVPYKTLAELAATTLDLFRSFMERDPYKKSMQGKTAAIIDTCLSVQIQQAYGAIGRPFVDLLGVPYTQEEVHDMAWRVLLAENDRYLWAVRVTG